MTVLVWSRVPHIRGRRAPDIVSRDCENNDKHDWHFFFDGAVVVYCPGPMKCFGETYPLCQVNTDAAKALPCSHKESGGYQCENLEPHTDAHSFGRHTICHSIAGNGYECDYIEKILEEYDRKDLTRS